MYLNLFYIVVGIGFVLSLIIQGWLRMTYAKWSRIRNSMNLPGAAVARHVLDKNGLQLCVVTEQPGNLTDHYDPRKKQVALSTRIFREPSVASAAIAAHETGHAIQDSVRYGPMQLRYKLLPLVQIASQYGPYAIMGGYFFGNVNIMLIGFLMLAASLLFQLITLPIEFDASKRARAQLEEMGFTSREDRKGARKILRAAAMTYVAGAATAMMQVLVILFIFGRSIWRMIFRLGKPI